MSSGDKNKRRGAHRGEDDEANYLDNRGGSTLIHRPAGPAQARTRDEQGRELPFVLHEADEEDIFTSAEWPDGGASARDGRRLIYQSGSIRDASGADPADLLAGRARPATAPPAGPVTYVPGKGIVPQTDKGEAARPSPPAPPAPPPLPDDARARAPRPPPRPPRSPAPLAAPPQGDEHEPTLVSAAPTQAPARPQSLDEVARLGALFSAEDHVVTNEIDLRALERSRKARAPEPPPQAPKDAPSPKPPPLSPATPPAPPALAAPPAPPAAPATAIPAPPAAPASAAVTPAPRAPEEEGETRTEVSIRATRARAVKLALLDEKGRVRESRAIEHDRAILGREDGDILLSDDPTASPWHAQVVVRRSGLFLKAMTPHNPVFLRLGREVALQDGDDLIIGQQRLVFRDRWGEHKPGADGTLEPGAPNPPEAARLLLKLRGGELGGLYFLGPGLLIGRGRGDLLFPSDPLMLPQHADLRRKGDTYTLRPLDPQADVFRAIRGEVEIFENDWFQIGATRLRVLFEK